TLYELLCELNVVINFAVEENRDGSRFIEYRLVPAFDIDDAESPHAESGRRIEQESIFDRPAMAQTLRHREDNITIRRLFITKDSGNSTHGLCRRENTFGCQVRAVALVFKSVGPFL